MDSLVASRAWPARVANTTLKDLDRELDQIKNDVADLERWRDRFYEAIHQGFVIDVRRLLHTYASVWESQCTHFIEDFA